MKRQRNKKGRFIAVHGGYSKTSIPHIQRYLTSVRRGLIRDLGGREGISTGQWILVDAVINMLGVTRAIEDHVKERIMHGDELAPSLGKNYLAYRNSIQRHLMTLGIEIRDMPAPTLAEIIDNIEAEKKSKGKSK